MATVIQKTISIKGGQVELAAGTSYANDAAFQAAYDAAVAGLDAPGRVDHSTYNYEYVRTTHPTLDAAGLARMYASGIVATV